MLRFKASGKRDYPKKKKNSVTRKETNNTYGGLFYIEMKMWPSQF